MDNPYSKDIHTYNYSIQVTSSRNDLNFGLILIIAGGSALGAIGGFYAYKKKKTA